MAQAALNADLSGKLAVVTGASSGIGREIARVLTAQGAEVILACRNLSKAEIVLKELLGTIPKAKVAIMALDLASLTSVRTFAKTFLEKHPRLNILVNNAGGWTTTQGISPDGIELTWATNVLGPELLSRLLLPALKAAGKARIVNVASTAAGGLDLQDIEFKMRKYSGLTAYSQTKQANRMLSWDLAGRLEGSGVVVNAMSPGLVRTELNRNAKGFLGMAFGMMVPLMGKSPAQGADTAAWLASSQEIEGVNGKFWEGRKEIACKFRSDTAAIKRLVDICDGMMAGAVLK